METLEDKAQRANLMQWVPGYGILVADRDEKAGLPIIFNTGNQVKDGVALYYQVISTASIGFGLSIGAVHLFVENYLK